MFSRRTSQRFHSPQRITDRHFWPSVWLGQRDQENRGVRMEGVLHQRKLRHLIKVFSSCCLSSAINERDLRQSAVDSLLQFGLSCYGLFISPLTHTQLVLARQCIHTLRVFFFSFFFTCFMGDLRKNASLFWTMSTIHQPKCLMVSYFSFLCNTSVSRTFPPSLPEYIVVPVSLADQDLKKYSLFFTDQRIPVSTYGPVSLLKIFFFAHFNNHKLSHLEYVTCNGT